MISQGAPHMVKSAVIDSKTGKSVDSTYVFALRVSHLTQERAK
jgi:hypothetical protein